MILKQLRRDFFMQLKILLILLFCFLLTIISHKIPSAIQLTAEQLIILYQLIMGNCHPKTKTFKQSTKSSTDPTTIHEGFDPNTTYLRLFNTQIKPQTCQKMILNKWPVLQSIQLKKNNIGDQGCEIISKGQWPALSVLQIQQNKITSLSFLCRSPMQSSKHSTFSKLIWLDLSNNLIESIEPLSQMSIRSLSTIQLNENNITNLKSIIKINAPSLTELWLYNNQINEVCGLEYMANRLGYLALYSGSTNQQNLSLKSVIKCEFKSNTIEIRVGTSKEQVAKQSFKRKYQRRIFD